MSILMVNYTARGKLINEELMCCFFFILLDPIPEPLEDESKKAVENEDANKDQFDSLPPELRKLMEQTKQREEAAAAAEAQQNNEQSMMERSATQGTAEESQAGKELTQTSLTNKDEKTFNGKFSLEKRTELINLCFQQVLMKS